MTKTAWVFPGQGSQTAGMGGDLIDIPAVKRKFDLAEQILGWSVDGVCQSDSDKLSRTLYTQPCLYVVECAISDLLRENGQLPDLVAGHSLGEYVALYTAQVYDFEPGLLLVKRRAELMAAAAGGKMVALVGFDREKLQQAIDNTDGVVLANDNSETQVVISGTPEAVDAVVEQVKTKRAVALKVSGAFHSPLMAAAAAEFETELESVAFQDAQMPVISNVEPVPTVKAAELKTRLVRQMTGSVRWREIMQRLAAEGIEQVLEVGPGKVLTGLLKRAYKEIELKNVTNITDVKNCLSP
ncbi:ACP S-malonyltransferase [Oscillatoria salina]|uniref:ACP S-malonyltransferase n=1 Tax=Oscillatoria salina TaxID=331517 RepID=UPI001CCCB3FF|nr:ACP S-malonyltransferase [Oscillatoria salina]MBZ8182903.1 ACP S-malonyltransferase [Oscillatoria salina IIICB1]